MHWFRFAVNGVKKGYTPLTGREDTDDGASVYLFIKLDVFRSYAKAY